METAQPSKITGPAFEAMVARLMGQQDTSFDFTVEEIVEGFAKLRLRFDHRHLRPGGTLAGPVIFALADTALFAAVLSTLGEEPMVFTSDMNLHFLRKPQAVDLIAECRIIKRGRQLVFGEVLLTSDGDPRPVAHVTGTYALPPEGRSSNRDGSI